LDALIKIIVTMREEEALSLTEKMLTDGVDPMQVLGAYRVALAEVGRLFEKGEYFLPELILSGEMLKTASEKIKPYFKGTDPNEQKQGKIIMATVEGDIHDIGKDIVTMMLDLNGFDVLDLGVDVPVERVTEMAKEFRPRVIGLSGFLTTAYDPMKATIEAVKKENLGDIKFMIGGGQMDGGIRDYVGADAYGKDAVEAVRLSKKWIGG